MHPPGDPEFELSDQRAADAEKAKDENPKNGRSVTRIDELEIQAALVAAVAQIEWVERT
jgi:hypothetical protein